MGCYIHAVIEIKDASTGKWSVVGGMKHDTDDGEDYVSPNKDLFGQNYDLFAVLADVRNGYGCAGYDTGDPVTPISSPRGVPEDASDDYKKLVEQWDGDGHSHSYHTLAQLLDYDWTTDKTSRGLVDIKNYWRWSLYGEADGDSPSEYCGDITGPNVRKVTRDEANAILADAPHLYKEKDLWIEKNHAHTYVKCEWRQPCAQTCGAEIWYDAIAPMMQLAKQHGGNDNVRLVFFFDN